MEILIAFLLMVIAVACIFRTTPTFTFRIEHVYTNPPPILQEKELNPDEGLEDQKPINLDNFIQQLHDVMGVNGNDSDDRTA